tara:strand:+ start:1347 stop:2051 length:705 start_codon:yes stop_codon:yes gene_type:complete
MKIIAIIPARHGSKRLPGKPLIQIKKKPLIQITYESVLNSNLFDLIFVATDSTEIKKTVRNFGGKCIITSPQPINGTERCAELIEIIDRDFAPNDLVINIQCDEPFIKKTHLEKIIKLFQTTCQIGTLISKINKTDLLDSSIVKTNIKNNTALNFSRTTQKLNHNFPFYKHIGIYAYQIKTLLKLANLQTTKNEVEESLEQLRWIDNNYKISCAIINDDILSINTQNDLKKIKK